MKVKDLKTLFSGGKKGKLSGDKSEVLKPKVFTDSEKFSIIKAVW